MSKDEARSRHTSAGASSSRLDTDVAAPASSGGQEGTRKCAHNDSGSYQEQISVATKGHGDMHDLTEQVTSVVNAWGIQTGTVNVFNVGSTAAIGMIEFEPGRSMTCPPF